MSCMLFCFCFYLTVGSEEKWGRKMTCKLTFFTFELTIFVLIKQNLQNKSFGHSNTDTPLLVGGNKIEVIILLDHSHR
jgi:hypothetical protein